ncbi:hypothetical protein OAQ01_00045 [Emcibacteraceae bacterium]|nr:hypothetical protein [Emcibacteraceae bacterium]
MNSSITHKFNQPKMILWALPLASISFLLNEILAPSSLGLLSSVIIFVGLIIFAIFDISKAYYVYLILIISSSPSPRNLSDLVGFKSNQGEIFYTFATTSFAGATLSIWFGILVSVIALVRILNSKEKYFVSRSNRNYFEIILSLFTVMLISTFVFSTFRSHLDFSLMLSDMRFFIITFTSIITLIVVSQIDGNRKFVYSIACVLFLSGFANGFEGVAAFVFDVATKSLKLSIGTQPYLLLPIFFALLYTLQGQKNILKLFLLMCVFVGAFRFSRGEMIFSTLLILMSFFVTYIIEKNSVEKYKKITLTITFFIALLGIGTLVLSSFNDRLLGFVFYKLNFFTNELASGNISASPGVRLYELINISNDGSSNIFQMLFGKGFGGYFIFDNPVIPYPLNDSDYSISQLLSGYYYKPHTFFNFLLLKGGIIVLLFYVGNTIWIFYRGIILLKRHHEIDIVFVVLVFTYMSIYFLNMFWQPNVMLFLSVSYFVYNALDEVKISTNALSKESPNILIGEKNE